MTAGEYDQHARGHTLPRSHESALKIIGGTTLCTSTLCTGTHTLYIGIGSSENTVNSNSSSAFSIRKNARREISGDGVVRSYMQYVNRSRKIGDIGKDEDLAWIAPIGLGSNRQLTDEFRPGKDDTIFLVSSLAGMSVPALDARIVVDPVRPLYPERCRALARSRTTVYPSGAGSNWFPMLDASDLFGRLSATTGPILGKLRDKSGRNLSELQRLQSTRTIRQLSEASSELIERWIAARFTAPGFVSYRSTDGAKLAFETSKFLARAGIPVWFDEWSISIRLDDLDRGNAEEQLMANIEAEMMKCCSVVQINSPQYGDSRWTLLEQDWSLNTAVFAVNSVEELPELRQRLSEFMNLD